MKITKLFAAMIAAAALISSAPVMADDADTTKFTVVKEIPVTSVKDQHRSGTCWAFSSLGFLEAEILRNTGKTYDLAEAYVIYKTYIDRAVANVRMHGDVSWSQGGSFYDVLYCLKNYGMMPESAVTPAGSLYGDTLFNHSELEKAAQGYLGAFTGPNAKVNTISKCWQKPFEAILEAYLGPMPDTFEYEGKTYTPQTFAQSLGVNADDYVSLTSFTHHPFYTQFAVEVQDNWRWGLSYNLPLDELMETMDNAIMNGYTVAWGADVSEKYFNRNSTSIASVPADAKNTSTEGSDQERWIGKSAEKKDAFNSSDEKTITQELRQEGFDNWETTDDHGMLLYGIAKDQNGKEYYMMKNSWGKYGKYKGFAYISKPYAAYKTINIVVNKRAVPKHIAKAIGLK